MGFLPIMAVMFMIFGTLFPESSARRRQFSTSRARRPPFPIPRRGPHSASSAIILFGEFTSKFNKIYQTEAEQQNRFDIFQENVNKIEAHNNLYEKGNHSYRLGINQFSDLTHEEFVKGYTGAKESNRKGKSFPTYYKPINLGDEPPSKNSERDILGSDIVARDQGQCGSCWAFGAVAALEIQVNKLTAIWRGRFSEQYLVDCVDETHGCDGGWHDHVYNYIQDNGIPRSWDYPYTAKDGKCNTSIPKSDWFRLERWEHVQPGRDDHLKNALVHLGPMAVVIHASDNFKKYKGGVFHDAHCTSGKKMNHIVLLAGYGTTVNGEDYWLIRNSHGQTWGDKGYMKLARTKNNHCYLSEHAYIPIIKKT